MSQKVKGNIRSLAPSLEKAAHRLFQRRVDREDFVSAELAREIYEVATKLGRRVGVLISRDGRIEEVVLGSKEILYLPDLGRYRLGAGRLRRLRLIFSDLSSKDKDPVIPSDIMGDLEKLRLDTVVSVKEVKGMMRGMYAYLTPEGSIKEEIPDFGQFEENFEEFITSLESELGGDTLEKVSGSQVGAVLISVSDRSDQATNASFAELSELARTAGVKIINTIVQKKKPDPKSVLGSGKLEEVTLQCLRWGAEAIIFDTELKPSQWRAVTRATDLKVLDRSMLILDIFAQRAQSSEGRLQVELAQLSYNLPRLTEQDSGLSRLSGGIGGRGPGETKLEISRRRARDRISFLEKRIEELGQQRSLKKEKRKEQKIPLVAIIGYTNVGKSTLFNALTGSDVLVENKLFATLDTYQRRLYLGDKEDGRPIEVIISDTVGFIRDLPAELKNAFRATIEEIREASVLIHVLDASDPEALEREKSVKHILGEMELLDHLVITVVNKSDSVNSELLEPLLLDTNGISVSALKRQGFDTIKKRISDVLVVPSVLSEANPFEAP